MLIKTKYKPEAGKTVVLRLVTGEELVGRVHSVDEKTISITKPIAIQMRMVSAQEAGLGFAPFMGAVDEDSIFTFSFDRLVVAPMAPREDIDNSYLHATTGLVAASPSTILKG
jgi:hypothetical protein